MISELIAFILEDGSFREDSEAMDKASWNEELAMIVFGKFYCHMLTISRRAFRDVYCNIKHSTFYATYQRALSIRRTPRNTP